MRLGPSVLHYISNQHHRITNHFGYFLLGLRFKYHATFDFDIDMTLTSISLFIEITYLDNVYYRFTHGYDSIIELKNRLKVAY